MREWWANVYFGDGSEGMSGVAHAGQHHGTRDDAVFYGCDLVGVRHADLNSRIHVRLKPEGAPRRYASEANRRAWEERPRQSKAFAEVGMLACLDDEGLIYDPRYL